MSDSKVDHEEDNNNNNKHEDKEDENDDNKTLISSRVVVTELLPAYKDNPGSFVKGIHWLSTKFSSMRKVRGDGNCFYRSLLFSYMEEMLALVQSDDAEKREAGRQEQQRFLAIIESSKGQLIKVGYDEFVFEMFYDEFVDLLTSLVPVGEYDGLTLEMLLEKFTGAQADCYTWYMRLLTAGHLIKHHQRFLPFIMTDDSSTPTSMADARVNQLLCGTEGDAAMRGYCQREVEPMGKESEELHAAALTEVLGLHVDIEYLDGRPFNEEKGLGCVHVNPSLSGSTESAPFVLHLLYRPGHYDILYVDKQPE